MAPLRKGVTGEVMVVMAVVTGTAAALAGVVKSILATAAGTTAWAMPSQATAMPRPDTDSDTDTDIPVTVTAMLTATRLTHMAFMVIHMCHMDTPIRPTRTGIRHTAHRGLTKDIIAAHRWLAPAPVLRSAALSRETDMRRRPVLRLAQCLEPSSGAPSHRAAAEGFDDSRGAVR